MFAKNICLLLISICRDTYIDENAHGEKNFGEKQKHAMIFRYSEKIGVYCLNKMSAL